MKYFIIVSSTAFLFSFCFRSSKSCIHLKNGKFYYFTKRSREKIDVYRSDSLQLEVGTRKDDKPSKNRVVWKGDCEYDMFINAFSDQILTGNDSIIAATPTRVRIIHIDSSFYVCTAKLSVFDTTFELRDTLYFVK